MNDYVNGVGLLKSEQTGKVLPLEFYSFGISKETYMPWHPVDSLCSLKLVMFKFTGHWEQDLLRENLRYLHPELEELIEVLRPFTSEFIG